jgi:hypothetical protein
VSADVLPFKQKPVKGLQKRQLPDDPHFFCKGCDGREFRIYADMRIYCVGCNQHIRLDRGSA